MASPTLGSVDHDPIRVMHRSDQMSSILLPSCVFVQVMIQRNLEGEPRPVLVAEELSIIVHVASTAHERPDAEPFPSTT